MNEPIKAGDKCEVITGMGRHKSPNIGLEVTVESRTGEHSQYGVVWKCTSPDLCQLDDGGGYIKPGWADIPAAWLRKISDAAPGYRAVLDAREAV